MDRRALGLALSCRDLDKPDSIVRLPPFSDALGLSVTFRRDVPADANDSRVVEGVVHSLNDAVHVPASGEWLRAIAPLLIVLSQCSRAPFHTEAALALRRVSAAAAKIARLSFSTVNGLFR